jgi:hypothetical protein
MDKKENFLNKKTKRGKFSKNNVNLSEKNQEKISNIESLYNKAKQIYELRVRLSFLFYQVCEI